MSQAAREQKIKPVDISQLGAEAMPGGNVIHDIFEDFGDLPAGGANN